MSDDKRESAWQAEAPNHAWRPGLERSLMQAGFERGWDARQSEVDALRQERDTYKGGMECADERAEKAEAELARVAPFLAIHGFNGYTMEAGD